MRKQLAMIALVVSTSIVGDSALAFVSQPPLATFTARATTTGTRTASFTAALRSTTDPDGATGPTQIGWSTINLDTTQGWQMSNTLIRFTFLVNDRLGGIQIYTNNTLATAAPRFSDPTPGDITQPVTSQAYKNAINPDSNPAGMLLGTTGLSSDRMDMAWSVKGVPRTPGTQIAAMDPNKGPEVDAGQGTRFQWLYLLDKATPPIDRNGDEDVNDTVLPPGGDPDLVDTVAFVNGNDFSKVIKWNSIHFGQGPLNYGVDADKRAYIYFQANFNQAAPGDTFQTSTLTLEAFIN